MVLSLSLAARAHGGPRLHIDAWTNGVVVSLLNTEAGESWVLQSATDGEAWEHFALLESTESGDGQRTVEVSWSLLNKPRAQVGLFRAVKLDGDAGFLGAFLGERAKWRLAGIEDYDVQLHQNFGMLSWSGAISVRRGEVVSFETLELQPPFASTPEPPTIDELFEDIARAIAEKAVTIDVMWDADHGFPENCYIDMDERIADEERGWTIENFRRIE